MKKFLKIFGYFLFLLAFIWVSAQLFFAEQTDQLLISIFSNETQEKVGVKELRVIYPEEALNLEPTSLYSASRQRLQNIYEPLVKKDRDLNYVPALALSWGLIDGTIWEFSLRPNVKFHDGSGFDVADVIASFKRAGENELSELKAFVATIEKLERIDDYTFRIHTKNPDPLLLSRLSNLLIMPAEIAVETEFLPVGTGPYRFREWQKGKFMTLNSFEDYWGGKPKFYSVSILVIPEKSKRVNEFLAGGAEMLNFVPYDAVEVIEKQGFKFARIPSLEVQFLVFNYNSGIFSDLKNRQMVSLAFNQEALIEKVGDFVRAMNQYVSNGVFGFSPDLPVHVFDFEKARELAKVLKGKTIQLHLPVGLDVLGERLREDLKGIGLNPVVSYLETDRLLKSFENSEADLYFLGFRSDTGDANDFLWEIVHSGGKFNVGHFSNEEVDKLIEASSIEMDEVKRLKMLQKIMEILSKDYFGIPLFEYQTVFAFVGDFEFDPRIDGFLYFEELK